MKHVACRGREGRGGDNVSRRRAAGGGANVSRGRAAGGGQQGKGSRGRAASVPDKLFTPVIVPASRIRDARVLQRTAAATHLF